jgi:hypothetical protein
MIAGLGRRRAGDEASGETEVVDGSARVLDSSVRGLRLAAVAVAAPESDPPDPLRSTA